MASLDRRVQKLEGPQQGGFNIIVADKPGDAERQIRKKRYGAGCYLVIHTYLRERS